MTEEIEVLKATIKVLTTAINDLCAASVDEHGSPKAPDRRDLMKARSMLPAWCSQSLTRKEAIL